MGRIYPKINGQSGDALIGTGDSVRLIFDLFSDGGKVHELFAFAMEEFSVFVLRVDQLQDQRSTGHDTASSRKEVPGNAIWHVLQLKKIHWGKTFLGLTSRRSSRVPTTFPRIVHRRRRFGAGRWPWALPVRWRHPASDWWSGSGPPYPDSLVAQTFWQEVLRAKLLGQTRALLAYGPEDVSGFTEDTLNQD